MKHEMTFNEAAQMVGMELARREHPDWPHGTKIKFKAEWTIPVRTQEGIIDFDQAHLTISDIEKLP